MISKVLLTLSAILAVSQAAPESENGVLVLTNDNFDAAIAENSHILVEFYAPWCGHCQALAPEYEKAAATLAKADPPVPLAKVDATVQEKLGQRFGIEGFPTLKWFVNGKDVEYTGGRTEDTIVSWVSKKTGPAFKDISCADVEAKVADNKLNLVLFSDTKEGALFDAFNAAAQQLDKYAFFVAEASCASDHGVSDAPGAAIFRSFDESPVAYTGAAAEEDLLNFLKAESAGTLFEFDEDSVEPIFHDQKPCVILMLEGEQPYKAAYAEAAKALKGDVLFSYSGVTDGIQEQLAEFIGVTAEDLPTIRIIEPTEENVRKFKYEGDVASMTAEDVKQFVNDFKDGKLTPFLKSDPIPESNDGPVTVVVGHSFEDIVLDATKDVLVKYYAPWCGHCQRLAPHWDQLGEHVKDVSDLVIAKFDATTNEHDAVQVEGFPTLTFYPKDNKEGVPAEGRSFNGLRKWLKENSEAYKAAFPDEEVEADAEEEEPEDGYDDEEEMPEDYDEDEDFEMDEGEEGDDDDMARLDDFEDMEDEPEGAHDEL